MLLILLVHLSSDYLQSLLLLSNCFWELLLKCFSILLTLLVQLLIQLGQSRLLHQQLLNALAALMELLAQNLIFMGEFVQFWVQPLQHLLVLGLKWLLHCLLVKIVCKRYHALVWWKTSLTFTEWCHRHRWFDFRRFKDHLLGNLLRSLPQLTLLWLWLVVLLAHHSLDLLKQLELLISRWVFAKPTATESERDSYFSYAGSIFFSKISVRTNKFQI